MSCYSVIGGGLGGLSTAFYIKQMLPSSRVLLLEESNRLGGWIQTTRYKDGSRDLYFSISIFTVMMGGKWFEQLFGVNPKCQTIENLAVSELIRILKISNDPTRVVTKIQKNCIPQYVVGHKDRVYQLRKTIKSESLPLSLIGSSYDCVGINDVIMSAKQQVQSVIKS